MITAVAALLPLEQDLDLARRWLERARLRHGDSSPLIADSMFLVTMYDRDTSEALIWARRSPRALLREGLALQLDGWLRAGVTKAARGAAVELRVAGAIPDQLIHQVLRPAIHPVLLTGSADLARAWLGALSEDERLRPELAEAVAIATAVRDGERGTICAEDAPRFDTLELEQLYLCERWDAIVERSRSSLGRGLAGRTSRFLFADAQLQLGMVDQARQGFAAVERDPSSRALEPFTSLLALERLGRLDEQAGEPAAARRRYEELLHAWNGLDTPLTVQLELAGRVRELAGDAE
jgi:hypothetical protein